MKFIHKKPKPKVDMTILEMSANVIGTPPADMPKQKKAREIKEFKPSNAAMTQTISLFEDIFENMQNKRDFKQFAGVILAGTPGTGKTTRIGLLSKLLGIELITVEAPHIVEEHIINIPFIVFNPSDNTTKGGSTQLEGDEFRIELADSNLFSQISKARVISDDQHLKNIYKQSRDIIELYEALGGSPEELPDSISEIRKTYSVILFLDEYFRQTSARIRNMLRNILNGKIGSHDIPKNTYIIYASNLHDQGIDAIPLNNQFEQIDLKNPTKDEWFSWLVFKFEKDEKVKLNKQLINRFHSILDNEHISNDDALADVRTSPRRWEQLLLYINASLPVKDEKEAISLLTNVKHNFRNYLDGSHAQLATLVLEATAELIKETSNIEVNPTSINASHDWRETLKHQIEQKKKLGHHRKYVPIISGLPGIGKTTQAEKLATEMDLRFIDLDCATLNAEDVIGLPLPKNKEDGKIETVFTIPSLYKQIMDKIAKLDKEYIDDLKQKYPTDFQTYVEEYKNRPYKYLIFFDELNRNVPKVFNAIRRILLEKNFGPSNDGHGKLLSLPDSAIMLGAINPHDEGAQELTEHMRDVLDIIDSTSSWKHTLEYLKEEVKVPGSTDTFHELSLDIIKKMSEKFRTKSPDIPIEQRPFFFDLGSDIYISPREYTQIYIGLVRRFTNQMAKIRKLDLQDMKPKEIMKLEKDLKTQLFHAIEKGSKFSFTKHQSEHEEFMRDLEAWIVHSDDIDIGEDLFYTKSFNTKSVSLTDILGETLDGTSKEAAHHIDQFVNFIKNVDNAKFREDMTEVLESRLKSKEDFDKYLLDTSHPKKILNGKKIETTDAETASLVENFLLEIIMALHLAQMSTETMIAVIKSYFVMGEKLLEDPKLDDENYKNELQRNMSKTKSVASKFAKSFK